MGAREALRTWRSAKQAAVRQYGSGLVADRAALQATKRFFKWLAKHPRRRSGAADTQVDRAILSSAQQR